MKNKTSLQKSSKSTRNSKIVGNFGEALLLYWFSKHGSECANIDHTGIDLIVSTRKTGERMGISVKSRSRESGNQYSSIYVKNAEFKKADQACKAFGCKPYFAFVSDAADVIRVFVISKKHLLKRFPCGKRVCSWKMTKKAVAAYNDSPEIMLFELKAETLRFWGVEAKV